MKMTLKVPQKLKISNQGAIQTKMNCQVESSKKNVAAPTPESSHKGQTGVTQAYRERYTIPTVKHRGGSGWL